MEKTLQSKIIRWVSGAVAFIILIIVAGCGENNSKKLVSPMGLSNEEVASCLSFLLTKKNAKET